MSALSSALFRCSNISAIFIFTLFVFFFFFLSQFRPFRVICSASLARTRSFKFVKKKKTFTTVMTKYFTVLAHTRVIIYNFTLSFSMFTFGLKRFLFNNLFVRNCIGRVHEIDVVTRVIVM